MAKDKKAVAAIKTARIHGDTELRIGDIEWKPTEIPDEIAKLYRLESLHLNAIAITDVSPLAKFAQLHSLTIYSVREVELAPIGQLGNLRQRELTGEGVTQLGFLSNLRNLQSLHIQGPIDDWSPLSTLTGLKQLAIQSDDQTDISPLASLTKLERLSISDAISPASVPCRNCPS